MTRRALSDRPWCSACPRAFCEDHLPTTAEIIGQCKRFQALGQKHPAQACFIRCDADCIKWVRPAGYRSPRHGMLSNSINNGSQCVG